MNVTDAAYSTVHDYPGGSESLAPRLKMSAAVLRGKVNPNNDRNVLSLAEASKIMGVTGDYQILHALNAEHGFVAQPIEAADRAGCILQAILHSNAADGELDRELQKALADGRVTPNELKNVQRTVAKAQAALLDLVAHCRAMSEGRARG